MIEEKIINLKEQIVSQANSVEKMIEDCLNGFLKKTIFITFELIEMKDYYTISDKLEYDDFFRISRSALINLRYLTHVDNKNRKCTLQADTNISLKIARNTLSDLAQVFKNQPE